MMTDPSFCQLLLLIFLAIVFITVQAQDGEVPCYYSNVAQVPNVSKRIKSQEHSHCCGGVRPMSGQWLLLDAGTQIYVSRFLVSILLLGSW
jgi:hypothetical protein